MHMYTEESSENRSNTNYLGVDANKLVSGILNDAEFRRFYNAVKPKVENYIISYAQSRSGYDAYYWKDKASEIADDVMIMIYNKNPFTKYRLSGDREKDTKGIINYIKFTIAKRLFEKRIKIKRDILQLKINRNALPTNDLGNDIEDIDDPYNIMQFEKYIAEKEFVDKRNKDFVDELFGKIEAAIKEIGKKPEYIECYMLKNIEGFKAGEIAEITGVPERVINTRNHRITEALIARLAAEQAN